MWAGAHLLGSEPGGAEGEAAEDAAVGGPGYLNQHLRTWPPGFLVT